MLKHHRESLANAVAKLKAKPNVLAVILGGSIAHGYALRNADIDLLIVVRDREYRKRLRDNTTGHWETKSATYKGGYIDGKYTSLEFMRKVATYGSEPARFAFRDATVVFSRVPGIPELLRRIIRYPEAGRESRRLRFLGQLEAWRWYFYEALKHRNEYLRHVAVTRIVLFGCRLVLLRNRSLYPYHKWMLREIERQKRRPPGMLALIRRMTARSDPAAVERFYRAVTRFSGATKPDHLWGGRFMLDSELNWIHGHPPVEDL